MPKLREKAPEKVSFTIRYEAAHLAAIDALAERRRITRAEATRDVMAAGLDALDERGPTLADVMRRLDEMAAVTTQPNGLPVEPIKAALAGLRAGRVRGAAAGVDRDKGEEAAVLDGVVLDAIVALARLLGEDVDADADAVPAGRIVGGPPRGRERRTGASDPRGEDAPGRRFADVLRDAIADRRMTLREAAAGAGVSLSTLQRAMCGDTLRGESLSRLRTWAGVDA